MPWMIRIATTAVMLAGAGFGDAAQADEAQAAVAAPVGTVVLEVHAVGAQIYECAMGSDGALAWQFREPIASLMRDGKTVGRHFAGPSWEATDGSRITGKVVGKAAGSSAADIPWLKLSVSDRAGDGLFAAVTTVQRIDTVGGVRSGPCPVAGALLAEPYAADYTFSRP